MFDTELEKQIDKSIEEKVDELLGKSEIEQSRKTELNKALHDTLRALLARIERGMSIEVRMLPPEISIDEDGEGEELSHRAKPATQELYEICAQLHFPPPQEQTVLKLTHIGDPSKTS